MACTKGNQPIHTLEEVLAAVEKGLTKKGTAKVLGVERATIYNYCKRWKTVADALEEKRAELVDIAESGLRARLEAQDWNAIAFTLKTLGKDSGYTERQQIEHTGAEGGPIEIDDARERLASRITSLAVKRGRGDITAESEP
jgi:predicted transcriptional regulator